MELYSANSRVATSRSAGQNNTRRSCPAKSRGFTSCPFSPTRRMSGNPRTGQCSIWPSVRICDATCDEGAMLRHPAIYLWRTTIGCGHSSWRQQWEELVSDEWHDTGKTREAVEWIFTRFATSASFLAGQPTAFVLAVGFIAVWILTGPIFGWSDS